MRFSVIIPIYNKADTIRAAVESVFSQTFYDFEIVVVDDGSTDEPENVLSDLIGEKLRLIHQENGGVSVARNTGIANAKGQYVCFLDGDDLWKPHHLETMYEMILKYPHARAFVTSHESIEPDGTVIHSSKFLRTFNADFETDDFLGLLNHTSYEVVNTNSICVNRSVFDEEDIHFVPGVRIGEDTDVWYRIGLRYKVAVSQTETTMYRREYSTATKESSHIQKWVFSLREKEILFDVRISKKGKESFIHLIDRYKMTCCREYMVAGNRNDAKKVLSEVKNKHGARYIMTRIFTILPYFLCRWGLRRSRSCQ